MSALKQNKAKMKVIKMLFFVIMLFALKVVSGQKSDFLRHVIEKRSYATNECQSGHMQKVNLFLKMIFFTNITVYQKIDWERN